MKRFTLWGGRVDYVPTDEPYSVMQDDDWCPVIIDPTGVIADSEAAIVRVFPTEAAAQEAGSLRAV